MRTLAITLITALGLGSLTTATATAARLLPPGCKAILPFQVIDGYGIRAFCDGRYRVVVHCETLIGKWYVQGNIATPEHQPSEAVCHGAVLTDYYVEIV